MAEAKLQKPLDKSNEINTDDLMGMTLHVDLHFMACLVSTSENPGTTIGVKHGKILKSSNSNVTLLGANKYTVFVFCSSMGSRKPLSKTLRLF